MLVKLQKVLFGLWISTLVLLPIIGRYQIFNEDLNGPAMLVTIGAGTLFFLGFWLIAVIARRFKKNKFNATKIPLYSIGLTMSWLILVATLDPVLSAQPPTSEVKGVVTTKKCFPDGGTSTWIIVDENANCSEEITKYRANEVKPASASKSVYKQPRVAQIDCTGPDGVVFKTTQQKCDEFNSAWNNDSKPSRTNPQNTTGLSEEEVQAMIIEGQIEQTLYEMKQDARSANYNSCLSEVSSKKNDCQSGCWAVRDSESNACSTSYLGSSPLIEYSMERYNECIAESSAKSESCYTSCSNTHSYSSCTY